MCIQKVRALSYGCGRASVRFCFSCSWLGWNIQLYIKYLLCWALIKYFKNYFEHYRDSESIFMLFSKRRLGSELEVCDCWHCTVLSLLSDTLWATETLLLKKEQSEKKCEQKVISATYPWSQGYILNSLLSSNIKCIAQGPFSR